MVGIRTLAMAAVPLIALIVSGCVSQSKYDALMQTNLDLDQKNAALQQQVAKDQQQVVQQQQQIAQQQQQIATMQQQSKFVEASSMLFPEGGFQLGAQGKQELDKLVPRLKSVQNAKIVVYGYTDNTPVGPDLRRLGVRTNLDLSSRRADAVVNYLQSQGVDPNIMSAKGRGDTHPADSNKTASGRAANRRIEIVLEGAGA